jgi:capsular exopolysaccharide synthesis family protein
LTIVVDFDLRRPSVNQFFKGNAEVGLSNFFLEELEVDEIIQHSLDLPNLHFISSGPMISNLIELITDKQLTIFFSYLRECYDVIIIDSSPIGMTSDCILLNNYVDNSLFVVRSHYTKKAMVEKAKELFDQNKLVNPSIVINGIKKQNEAYGYNYKDYGYA